MADKEEKRPAYERDLVERGGQSFEVPPPSPAPIPDTSLPSEQPSGNGGSDGSDSSSDD